MPNAMSMFDKVSRSGDTMTGDLDLGLNLLKLTNGTLGGVLRGSPTEANKLQVRSRDDALRGTVQLADLDATGDISLSATKTVDGVDVSEIPQAGIVTGTYVGDGSDDRDINIGVNLAAKSKVYIVIKHAGTTKPRHRIEYAQGDLTMFFDASADSADEIQGLTSTGFQVGAGGCNGNGQTFRYAVFYE